MSPRLALVLITLILLASALNTIIGHTVAYRPTKIAPLFRDGEVYVKLLWGEEEIGSIAFKVVPYPDKPPSDILVSINVKENKVKYFTGPGAKMQYTLRLVYEVNGERRTVYKVGDSWVDTISVAETVHAPLMTKVTLLEAIVTVNIYDNEWNAVSSASVDLVGLAESYNTSHYLIPGINKLYFTVKERVVDPRWIEYQLLSGRGVLGVIKVTSQGPFNSSKAIRVYYDSRDELLARYAKLEAILDAIVSGASEKIVLRIEPGGDLIIPSEIEGIINGELEAIRSLILSIEIQGYAVKINVTKDLGMIRFVGWELNVSEFRVRRLYQDVVGPGVVMAIYELPFYVGPEEIRVSYEPAPGTLEPGYIICSINYDEETGRENLTVYLVVTGEGLVGGRIVLSIEKSPSKISIGEAELAKVAVRGASFREENLTPGYSILQMSSSGQTRLIKMLSLKGILGDYNALGGVQAVSIVLNARELKPGDFIVVKVNLSYTIANPLLGATVIPIPLYTYREWAPPNNVLAFLLNGTDQGLVTLRGNNGTTELSYVIPVASLVGYGLERLGSDAPKPVIDISNLILLVTNADKLEVNEIEAYIARYTSGGSGEAHGMPLWLTFLAALLIVVIATLGLILRSRSRPGIR